MLRKYALPEELHACPACHAARLSNLHYVQSSRFIKRGSALLFVTGCDHCGLIFVNPPPSAAELAATYAEHGKWNAKKHAIDHRPEESGHLKSVKDVGLDPARSNVHSAVVYARQRFGTTEGLKVLDFGCGEGELLDKLAAFGFATYGLDPASHNFVTAHTMLTALPSTPTFDVIVAKHVLEHLANPLDTLRDLRACLKTGGLFLVATPTLDGLEHHGQLDYCLNQTHLVGYTRRSLSALLALAGFQTVECFGSVVPQRFRIVAVTASEVRRIRRPLKDARATFRAFRRHQTQEPGWWALLPVRWRAAQENVRVMAQREARRRDKEARVRASRT